MISIIIPSYNRQDYIAETLDSVLNQTYQDWECIIVDDGSIDETKQVVKLYTEKDSRFQFFHRPDNKLKGANSCRNFGFENAKGKYIKFLDSDDLLTPDCLKKQVKFLEENDNLQVCTSYGRFFNDETKELEEFWSRNMEYDDYLLGHINNQIRWQTADPLWIKSFFKEPPFKEGLMNSQEWLMHGEAFLNLKNEEIYNLKETFTLIRKEGNRISTNPSKKFYKNQRKAAIVLFGKMCMKGIFNPKYYVPLVKQMLGQIYMQIKTKN